ncbi:hypothetical protein GW17_00000509 [Ensete ventricosum]|nr:hypothetical protein GW17_00000509 [Ensete ventricosum]
MAVRFLTGPAVMAAASIAVGLRGGLLRIAIVQWKRRVEGIGVPTFGRPPTGPDVGGRLDPFGIFYDILSLGILVLSMVGLPVHPAVGLLPGHHLRHSYQGFVGEWSCSGGALGSREDPLLYHETRTWASMSWLPD